MMSFISWPDIISVVVPEPKVPQIPYPKIYYQFIPESPAATAAAAAVNSMVSTDFRPTTGVNFPSMTNLFSLLVKQVFQAIYLSVSF